jgi:catechol O-methyltransferase
LAFGLIDNHRTECCFVLTSHLLTFIVIPIQQMNVGDVKGKILDAEFDAVAPKRVVELGAYCGYSAVRMAARMARGGTGSDAPRLVSIELNPAYAAVARAVIAHAGLSEIATVVVGTAAEVLPGLCAAHFGGARADFVFFDHWKDAYAPDARVLLEHSVLRDGGVLLADNVIYPGAPEFLELVRAEPRFECRHIRSMLEYSNDQEDGVEVCVFREPKQ